MEFSSEDFEARAASDMEAVAAEIREITPLGISSCLLPQAGSWDRERTAAEVRAAFGTRQKSVYAISLPNADPVEIHSALTRARGEKRGERSYARLLPLTETATPLLYVGSSLKLDTRLLDHIGFGYHKTSSLHLSYWAQELGPIRIDARCYADDVPADLLCKLEDYMANQLRPLFGKRGSV